MDSLYWDTVKQIYGTHGKQKLNTLHLIELIHSKLVIVFYTYRFGREKWSVADFCGTVIPNVLLSERNGYSGGSSGGQHYIVFVSRYHVRTQFISDHLSPSSLHERYHASLLKWITILEFQKNCHLIFFSLCLIIEFQRRIVTLASLLWWPLKRRNL